VSHLLSVLHQAGVNTLDGASYTYDPAGNRTAKTNSLNGITSNYSYDPLYELTQVTQGSSTTESYSYDPVGNRLSSSGVPSYSYNTSNELTTNSLGSYTYDANGNTLTDASGKSYTWDFENRLTQAVVPGTNGGTTTFKYDPFGRRIYKQSPNFTSIFVYDGPNLIQTMNGSGGEVASYAQGRYIDEVLGENRSGESSYYERDGVNSVTSLTTSAGATVSTYTYDSFGNLANSTGTLGNPFRYTGREFDPETGIYFYRSRYYDAVVGRFTREDPLRFGSGDPNFYEYVGNDPADYSDPTGRRKYYGNWCGPDWTGGLPEEYNPLHAGLYKPPINRYDTVCMHHDICYFKCRNSHQCDPGARSDCFKTCDQIFVGEMPGWTLVPDALSIGIFWHQLGPDPGPNKVPAGGTPSGCGCGAR